MQFNIERIILELTFQQVADNLGVSNSSIHRWCKQFDDAKNENEDSNLFRGSGNFSSDEAKRTSTSKKKKTEILKMLLKY